MLLHCFVNQEVVCVAYLVELITMKGMSRKKDVAIWQLVSSSGNGNQPSAHLFVRLSPELRARYVAIVSVLPAQIAHLQQLQLFHGLEWSNKKETATGT